MKKYFSKAVSAIALLIGFSSVVMAQVTLPYTETFGGNGDQYLVDHDWENIDADADGKKWVVYSKYIHGTGFVSFVHSSSKDDTTPDNWLISPDVSGVKSVSYALGSTMPDKFQEHYSLLISKKNSRSF